MFARRATLVAAVVALLGTTAAAHDLFLRPDVFFVAPGKTILLKAFSGTFSTSENAITRDRLADLSVTSPAGRVTIDKALWTERAPQSTLAVAAPTAGTYVLGAAVHPKMLKLEGAAFNAYLKDEGIDEVLAARTAQGRLKEGSRERSSKFVKALVQVGDTRTDSVQTALGYSAELVPLANPYTLHVGDSFSVRCLVDGKPMAGQVLFAGGRTPKGTRIAATRLVADANGVVRVQLTSPGAWYLKFVHMREVTDPEANYESRWSTLTWGLR